MISHYFPHHMCLIKAVTLFQKEISWILSSVVNYYRNRIYLDLYYVTIEIDGT